MILEILISLKNIFKKYNKRIVSVIHCAAQPSHDWAAREPLTDFSINATGTLNLLELTRQYANKSKFIFLSTNKVYGDKPNKIKLVEKKKRYEPANKIYKANGIGEDMSIDNSKHSIFGSSKVAADILVQEYGKYFNLNTVCFRGRMLNRSLPFRCRTSWIFIIFSKCCLNNKLYKVYGYKGNK